MIPAINHISMPFITFYCIQFNKQSNNLYITISSASSIYIQEIVIDASSIILTPPPQLLDDSPTKSHISTNSKSNMPKSDISKQIFIFWCSLYKSKQFKTLNNNLMFNLSVPYCRFNIYQSFNGIVYFNIILIKRSLRSGQRYSLFKKITITDVKTTAV